MATVKAKILLFLCGLWLAFIDWRAFPLIVGFLSSVIIILSITLIGAALPEASCPTP